jgi:protein TilB
MVEITETLIRKRSEHNEGVLWSLQEVALHQFKIERINRVLERRCRQLKILLLQNNRIRQIENVHGLKDLRYLNLALNRITRIDNLSQCEFLAKLDLTANYVYDLRDVRRLRDNHHLSELFLMGNPAADHPLYRPFVIATLPTLKSLDAKEISRTERAQAIARYDAELLPAIESASWSTPAIREDADDYEDSDPDVIEGKKVGGPDPDKVAAAQAVAERRTAAQKARERAEEELGRIIQCNEPGLDFRFEEDTSFSPHEVVLTVDVPPFLSTGLIDVQTHPTHVEVTVKSKLIRLALPCEVRPDHPRARVLRATATGALKVYMPVAEGVSLMTAAQARRAQELANRAKPTLRERAVAEMEAEEAALAEEAGDSDLDSSMPDLI